VIVDEDTGEEIPLPPKTYHGELIID